MLIANQNLTNKNNFTNQTEIVQDLRNKTKLNFEKLNDSLFEAFENLKVMISIVNQELCSTDKEQQEVLNMLNQKLSNSLETVDKMKDNLDKSMKEKKVKKKVKCPKENTIAGDEPNNEDENENKETNINEIKDENEDEDENKSESESESASASDSDKEKSFKRSNSDKFNKDNSMFRERLNLNLRQKSINNKRLNFKNVKSEQMDNLLKKDLFNKLKIESIKPQINFNHQDELDSISELVEKENENENFE